ALCSVIVKHCSPASVMGIEPSEGFLQTARKNLAGQAMLCSGSATSIPLEDASVDAVVSGLVLNFVADQPAALAEMSRVTRPGGTVAAYLWDYAGKMEMLRFFWDAAVEFDAGSVAMDEGVRFPLCNPEALGKLFAGAALQDIEVTAIDVQI